jgi:hypothetical protein
MFFTRIRDSTRYLVSYKALLKHALKVCYAILGPQSRTFNCTVVWPL